MSDEFDDEEEMPGTNFFIVSWDMTGLECVIDAGAMMSDEVMAALKSPTGKADSRIGSILHQLRLRAQYNLQRHYEIYTIHTSKAIGKEDLEDMFEQAPQAAADLIRARGQPVYSDRIKPGATIIR
jgi:hypothetical protein